MRTPPPQFKSSHSSIQSRLQYETHPAYPGTVSHSPFVLQGNNFSIFILTSNHICCPVTSSQSSIVDPCYSSLYVCLQSLGLWFFFFFFNKYHPLPNQNSTQWINSLINKHLHSLCQELSKAGGPSEWCKWNCLFFWSLLTGGDKK